MQRILLRFTLGLRIYHVYRWGAEHPSPMHHPITGSQVRILVGSWLNKEIDTVIGWRHLVTLYEELAFSEVSAQAPTCAHLGDWLVEQIRGQRFRLYEELPPMKQGQSFEEYARIAHVPVMVAKPVEKLPQASSTTPQQAYGVMDAPGGPGGLSNETSPECPSASFRSERMATVHPSVLTWFNDTKTPPGFRPDILGENEGGGFLATTTRVVPIEKGTVLFRYFGGDANALSTWWFTEPFEGDPRVFAALPVKSSADKLVKARVRKDIKVLAGIGAPRCSNKPGGPVQYFVQYQPARTTHDKVENDFLELI